MLPEDVQRVAGPVLAHRMTVKPEARYKQVSAERIIAGILKEVRVPMKGDAT